LFGQVLVDQMHGRAYQTYRGTYHAECTEKKSLTQVREAFASRIPFFDLNNLWVVHFNSGESTHSWVCSCVTHPPPSPKCIATSGPSTSTGR
jgi:hypothetical protein